MSGDNATTKFIINKRTGAYITVVNLFFTITRLQNGQIRGLNEAKRHRKHKVNKEK